jgi:hypothetical protein
MLHHAIAAGMAGNQPDFATRIGAAPGAAVAATAVIAGVGEDHIDRLATQGINAPRPIELGPKIYLLIIDFA